MNFHAVEQQHLTEGISFVFVYAFCPLPPNGYRGFPKDTPTLLAHFSEELKVTGIPDIEDATLSVDLSLIQTRESSSSSNPNNCIVSLCLFLVDPGSKITLDEWKTALDAEVSLYLVLNNTENTENKVCHTASILRTPQGIIPTNIRKHSKFPIFVMSAHPHNVPYIVGKKGWRIDRLNRFSELNITVVSNPNIQEQRLFMDSAS